MTQPIPPDVSDTARRVLEEFRVKTTDEVELAGFAEILPEAIGTVLIVHGLGEHSGRYRHLQNGLTQAGLNVVRFDLRGHGLSEGPRGRSRSYNQLLDDITRVRQWVSDRFPQQPIVMYGHSLGGNLVANWILKKRNAASPVAGAVLSSPWFLLVDQPGILKQSAIRLLAKVFPNFPLQAKFDPRRLSKDTDEVQSYRNDPLVHTRIGTALAAEAFEAGRFALEHSAEFSVPCLCLHGKLDSITDPDGTIQFSKSVPHCTLKIFENMVHEPHNDLNRDEAIATVSGWIQRLLKGALEPYH